MGATNNSLSGIKNRVAKVNTGLYKANSTNTQFTQSNSLKDINDSSKALQFGNTLVNQTAEQMDFSNNEKKTVSSSIDLPKSSGTSDSKTMTGNYTRSKNIFHDGKFEIDNIDCDKETKETMKGLEKASIDLQNQIDQKQGEIDKYAIPMGSDPRRSGKSTQEIQEQGKIYQEKYKELNPQIEELKNQKAYVDSVLYQLKMETLKQPYMDLSQTEGFQKYKSEYSVALAAPGDLLVLIEKQVNDGTLDIEKIESTMAGSQFGAIGQKFDDMALNYKYMSEDQRMMYHYLYSTEGEESAENYLKVIQDDINKAAGAGKAAKFLEKLDYENEEQLKESLANYFNVSVKGLGDGIDSFYNGLNNAIISGETLTAEQYESMVILQALAEKSKGLDNAYEITSSIGNMAVPMAVSAVVSFLATPAAGEKVASVLMGVSAFGNARQQTLAQGYSTAQSVTYAATVGVSETVTDYFLGAIPGISKEVGFSLKSLLKEGGQELIQEYMDAGCRAVILGEDIDIEQLGKDGIKSFVYGVAVAGILNGGQATINVTMNGVAYAVDTAKLQTMIKNSNGNVDIKTIQDCVVTDDMQYDYSKNVNHNNTKLEADEIYRRNLNNKIPGYDNYYKAKEIQRSISQLDYIKDQLDHWGLSNGANNYGNDALIQFYKTGSAYQIQNGKAVPYITNTNGIRTYLESVDPVVLKQYLDGTLAEKINILNCVDSLNVIKAELDQWGLERNVKNYGENALRKYAETGSVYRTDGKPYITSQNNIRSRIENLNPDTIKQYLDGILATNVDLFDYLDYLDSYKGQLDSWGEEHGVKNYGEEALRKYAETGSVYRTDGKPYITSQNNIRQYVESLDPNIVKQYLDGSLRNNIGSMVGNQKVIIKGVGENLNDSISHLFSIDGISDSEVIRLAQETFKTGIDTNNPNTIKVQRTLLKLKHIYPDIKFEKGIKKSYWSISEKKLVVSNVDWLKSGTFSHELGHLLFDLVANGQMPKNWNSIVNRARIISSNNNSLVDIGKNLNAIQSQSYVLANAQFLNELKKSGFNSMESYEKKLTNDFAQMLGSMTEVELKGQLSLLGFSDDQIDMILQNGGSATGLARQSINNDIAIIKDRICREQYSDYCALSDIVDAVFEGTKKDTNGNNISVTYSHTADYYKNGAKNFPLHEIIANYNNLKLKTPDRVHYLKYLFGEEFYNCIETLYNDIISFGDDWS